MRTNTVSFRTVSIFLKAIGLLIFLAIDLRSFASDNTNSYFAAGGGITPNVAPVANLRFGVLSERWQSGVAYLHSGQGETDTLQLVAMEFGVNLVKKAFLNANIGYSRQYNRTELETDYGTARGEAFSTNLHAGLGLSQLNVEGSLPLRVDLLTFYALIKQLDYRTESQTVGAGDVRKAPNIDKSAVTKPIFVLALFNVVWIFP